LHFHSQAFSRSLVVLYYLHILGSCAASAHKHLTEEAEQHYESTMASISLSRGQPSLPLILQVSSAGHASACCLLVRVHKGLAAWHSSSSQPLTCVSALQLGTTKRKCNMWLPYEGGFSENSILFPWVPRHFYQVRWLLIKYSPLSRRVGRLQCTCGEALMACIIIGEMIWMAAQFAADPDFRVDVKLTGMNFGGSALKRRAA
jgi:hypothetical protein